MAYKVRDAPLPERRHGPGHGAAQVSDRGERIADHRSRTDDGQEEEAPTAGYVIDFVDPDGNPIEGVVTVVRYEGEDDEETSDASGRVVFEDVDPAAAVFDITIVYAATAYTTLGMGGSRPTDSPAEVTLGTVIPDEDVQIMRGRAVHSTSGSYVLVSTPLHPAAIHPPPALA